MTSGFLLLLLGQRIQGLCLDGASLSWFLPPVVQEPKENPAFTHPANLRTLISRSIDREVQLYKWEVLDVMLIWGFKILHLESQGAVVPGQ